MLKNSRVALIGFTALLLSASIHADSYSVSSSCYKPHKPYEFNSQWELDSFNNDVDRYKECISDFVDEQNRAVRNHQRAASEAIEEWNSYVRYELN